MADTVADLVTSLQPVRERTEPDDAPLAVETHGLTKRFGRQIAVDHIDLVVPRGSVYGFLGPNGSGRTTTIRMLLGLVSPTDGEQSLLGRPMPASFATVLPRVGALIEGPAFHPYLSGRSKPGQARCRGSHGGSAFLQPAGRCSAGPRRIGCGCPQALPRILPGDAATTGARGRDAATARAARPRRTDQRARSAGGPARCAAWSEISPATARRCSCPRICLPRSSRCAPTSG